MKNKNLSKLKRLVEKYQKKLLELEAISLEFRETLSEYTDDEFVLTHQLGDGVVVLDCERGSNIDPNDFLKELKENNNVKSGDVFAFC